ncbi:c-di-GMP-binding flagellar brake protein YcgR, contains PilZNR and PilZ domains [Caloramator quimbayensis]|uniref:C-di-GMP-binding flagellar brake protein YcgR, contains PilZNR and PilZ domains n=1 Tax=Caloramator quimbayensis TaxID=1147123 RepID=A0A1T4XAH4_9CLOT|nr:flagellar brake domain-containing protein [Caloramator quimbayensis]SKA86489.1 c-di-GMP-binding flagellar brake protein YcgR, contains PilZNR and PilZ domains [Caloramator quimbayensis]
MVDFKIKLEINQSIEIIENQITYKSSIQDIKEDYVLIGMPISGSRYLLMHPKSIIEYYMMNEKEVFKCRSVVLGRTNEKNLQLAMLSFPDVIERVQRREYFRLPIVMEAKFFPLPEGRFYMDLKDVPSGYFKKLENTITVDISGGGIKIISKQNVKKDNYVLLSINIPEEINVLCKVIRCDFDNMNKNYKLALKFERIDERIRDNIIRFIFSKLREQSRLFK